MKLVRIFVACTPAERLPMRVLAFTIQEAASQPVQVQAIQELARPIPRPRDLQNQPRTPFSFQRFLIPELCAFQGRAIYLDADMQVFADIAEIWKRPMEGHDLLAVSEGSGGRRGQFSVMLLDCERLRWQVEDIVAGLDAGRFSYEELMQDMCVADSVGRTLSPHWNSLERYEPGVTRLLHYTDMDTQPWVSLDNPLEGLWVDALRRAVAAGVIALSEVETAVQQGHVRPSLLAQLRGTGDSRAALRRMDADFVAPFKSIRSGYASPFLTWRDAFSARAQRGLQRLRALVLG